MPGLAGAAQADFGALLLDMGDAAGAPRSTGRSKQVADRTQDEVSGDGLAVDARGFAPIAAASGNGPPPLAAGAPFGETTYGAGAARALVEGAPVVAKGDGQTPPPDSSNSRDMRHGGAGSDPSMGPLDQLSEQDFDGEPMRGDLAPPRPRAPFQFEQASPISLVHNGESHGADEAEAPAIVVTRLTAQTFETRFPPLAAQILPVQTAPMGDADRMKVSIDASIARLDDPTSQHRVAPVKILAFELEPRSLGAMSVRMRMSASNIELQISVDSVDALRLLGSARDKLLEAIESTGVKVDSFTVRVSPMPASADDSQNAPADRSQGAMSDNSEGHRGSLIGQDGAGRERKRENQSGWPHDDGARTQADPTNPRGRDRVAGLYL